MRSPIILLAFLLSSLSQAEAAVYAQYNFTSDTNVSALGAGVSSTYDGSHLYDSYVGNDGFGNVLQAYPTSGTTTHDNALANNIYFSINLTGSNLNLGVLQFDVGKGGNSDPRGYFIRSSVDGFASDIFSTLLPSGSASAPALQSIDFSSLSAFQNLTTINFRFYLFTPSIGNSVDFQNLTLNSNINNVPEPSALLLLITGAAPLLWGMGMGGFFNRAKTKLQA